MKRYAERGASTLAVLLFLPAVFAMLGLVHDAGAVLAGRRTAQAAASAGARAAALQVDGDALYSGSVARIASVEADAAARAVVGAQRSAGGAEARFVGLEIDDERRRAAVTVVVEVEYLLLDAFGLAEPAAGATSHARVAGGVDGREVDR